MQVTILFEHACTIGGIEPVFLSYSAPIDFFYHCKTGDTVTQVSPARTAVLALLLAISLRLPRLLLLGLSLYSITPSGRAGGLSSNRESLGEGRLGAWGASAGPAG